jgi:hypothetical protein
MTRCHRLKSATKKRGAMPHVFSDYQTVRVIFLSLRVSSRAAQNRDCGSSARADEQTNFPSDFIPK